MYKHEPQTIHLQQYKLESLIKQQYKIHSCDPLYILMISDGTTTFKMVKDITKRYLARDRGVYTPILSE